MKPGTLENAASHRHDYTRTTDTHLDKPARCGKTEQEEKHIFEGKDGYLL